MSASLLYHALNIVGYRSRSTECVGKRTIFHLNDRLMRHHPAGDRTHKYVHKGHPQFPWGRILHFRGVGRNLKVAHLTDGTSRGSGTWDQAFEIVFAVETGRREVFPELLLSSAQEDKLKRLCD